MSLVELEINGKKISQDVEERQLLVHFIRDDLNLTGTHVGCDTSQCGACVIHVDGKAVKSCSMLAVQANDTKITTIEGLENDNGLNNVQKAFKEFNAAQCGYCTSGIIVSITALFDKNKKPSSQEIQNALDGHLCRCGSHSVVLKAIDSLIEN